MVSTKALESPNSSEKLLELDPRQRAFGLASTLVLMPAEADPATKERSCKWDAVSASGAGGVKMIFSLLAEVVALHVGLPEIEVRERSF